MNLSLLFVYGFDPNGTSAISFHSFAKLKIVKHNPSAFEAKRENKYNISGFIVCQRDVLLTLNGEKNIRISFNFNLYFTGSDAIYRLTVFLFFFFCCIFPSTSSTPSQSYSYDDSQHRGIQFRIYMQFTFGVLADVIVSIHIFIWPSE